TIHAITRKKPILRSVPSIRVFSWVVPWLAGKRGAYEERCFENASDTIATGAWTCLDDDCHESSATIAIPSSNKDYGHDAAASARTRRRRGQLCNHLYDRGWGSWSACRWRRK